MKPINSVEYKGYTIEILPDEDAESPRDLDNLGTMVCFHKRYNLGDGTDLQSDMFNGWAELEAHLRKEAGATVILPLYLYDHSGLRIRAGSFRGLLPQGHAEFDSGQVGFIYISKEKANEELGKRVNEKRLIKILQAEVETYDDYLSGNVYGYRILKEQRPCSKCKLTPKPKEVDSCWGFIGDSDYVLQEAKRAVDSMVTPAKKKAKVKR